MVRWPLVCIQLLRLVTINTITGKGNTKKQNKTKKEKKRKEISLKRSEGHPLMILIVTLI
jgi:hypothetical protein